MIKEVRGIYFSPSGATKQVISSLSSKISKEMDEMCLGDIKWELDDIIANPIREVKTFNEDSIVVFGVPVFAGRVPSPCIPMIKKLKADNTLAVAVVSYGNSTYGDALYELNSLLEDQGFKVISAGAFISNHSMFNKIAKGRPDAKDHELLDRYANLCSSKLKRFASTNIQELKAKPAPLRIKGSMPIKLPMKMPIRPAANKKCVKCGVCASVCPTGAININDPTKVDASKCVSCTTCISVCPNGARGFFGPIAGASGIAFEKLCSKRKEPEWFI